MKISRFLDDIMKTSVSQASALIFGVVIMKLMAVILSKEAFGLFNLIRRNTMVLVPLVTLNLGVGLAKYIASEPKKSNFFMNISILFPGLIMTVFLGAIVLFPQTAAYISFGDSSLGTFTLISFVNILAYAINLQCYSYYRGKLEVQKANSVWTVFFAIPIFFAFLSLIVKNQGDHFIIGFFFLSSSVAGLLYSLYHIRHDWSIMSFFHGPSGSSTGLKGMKLRESKGILLYSISRIPANLFITLILSIPVYFANYRISLAASGEAAIVTNIVRLLSIMATPFNMVFLPKFSHLKSIDQVESIKKACETVIDFIVRFLPFVAVGLFGLSRFILVLLFDKKYLSITDSLALSILFSVFFVAYALVRGILDGLYDFPYVNIITGLGIVVTIGYTFIFAKNDIYSITLGFCAGIVTIGVCSIAVLVKKLHIRIQWKTILSSIIVSGIAFGSFYLFDRYFPLFHSHELIRMSLMTVFRVVVLLGVFYFYWRKNLWFSEFRRRISFGKK